MRDSVDGLPESTPQAAAPNVPQTVAPGSIDTAPESIVPQDTSVEELLVNAEAAFRNRRYTAPEADNALTYYRSVLAHQPDNGEALEGLQRIRSLLDARLQAALAERRIDEASGALAQLKLIDGANPAFAATEARIVELRITAALESGNLDRASLLLRDATEAGRLPNDRLATLHADLERRQAAAQTQRQVAEAARRYAELRGAGPGSASAESAQRNAAAPGALAAGEPTDVAGAGPTTDSRAAGTGTAENWSASRPGQSPATPHTAAVRMADFKRTRYVEPVYPKDALKNGVRGEVRLRLTVDTEGRVKQSEVISSSPPGVFDESALAAVRRWRFRPIEVNGNPIEASATTTVVFQPAEGARR
jgi:protein TonB